MIHRAEYESIKRGRALDAEQAIKSVLRGSQQDIDHSLVGSASAGSVERGAGASPRARKQMLDLFKEK
jgi:hypothetical protein